MKSILHELMPEQGDTTAIIGPTGEILTHKALIAQTENWMRALADFGLVQGHRVATLLPDALQTPVLTTALMSVCSVVPLNPNLMANELAAICQDAGISALLADNDDQRAQNLAASLDVPLISLDKDGNLSAPAQILGTPSNRPAGLVLLTSGSTGLPKRVPLTPENLGRSARNIATSLQLGPQDRALHALPMFHIGAIVDLFLAPLSAGGSLRVCSERTPQALLAAAISDRVTWMQLVPTMLHRMLAELSEQDGKHLGHGLRFLRSVSSDLAPEVHRHAEAFLNETPIIQMYGLTETAGQVATNPLPPMERRLGTVGRASGAEIAILDSSGTPLPPGTEGEVCLRGPSVMRGYEGQNKDAFFADWFRSGDLGTIDADGYLTLVGRLKEQINRGGEKISPRDIERAALRLEGVDQAVAYGLPHASLGEQVALTVTGDGLLAEDIKDALSRTLPDFKRPHAVRCVDVMPLLGSGKLDRRAVRTAHEVAQGQRDAQEDLNSLQRSVATLWQDILGSPAPSLDDDFFELGGDSLAAVSLLDALQSRYGLDLDANELFRRPTLRGLCAALEDGQGAVLPSDPTLRFVAQAMASWPGVPALPGGLMRQVGPNGTREPLFLCMQAHHVLAHLNQTLAADRTLYALRSLHSLPRSARGPTEIDRLAQVFANEIQQLQPSGLIYLITHCEGGKITARAAQILHEQGREIACVIYIDHWPKQIQHWPVLHASSMTTRNAPAWHWMDIDECLATLAPKGHALLRLDVDHYDVLKEHVVEQVTAFAAPYLEGKTAFKKAQSNRSGPLDEVARTAWRHADVRLKVPWAVFGQSTRAVRVRVRNRSSEIWGPTRESGLHIELDRRDLKTKERSRVALLQWEQHVPPGGTVEVTFDAEFAGNGAVFFAGLRDDGFSDLRDPDAKVAVKTTWAF